MIPEFNEDGLLPEGVHRATLEEFKERFVKFDRLDKRLRIFDGLSILMKEAAAANIVKRVLIAGSYVTIKPEPNDFDCLIVLDKSIRDRELRPFEYRFLSRRLARKLFGGDLVAQLEESAALEEYLQFFQTTRDGSPVGIVEIEL